MWGEIGNIHNGAYYRDRSRYYETSFRFKVKKIKGIYKIMIGLRGFKDCDYIPVSECAYASTLKDYSKFETESGEEANFICRRIRDWFLGRQERHYNLIRNKKKTS